MQSSVRGGLILLLGLLLAPITEATKRSGGGVFLFFAWGVEGLCV
jgi:hypothetical protein